MRLIDLELDLDVFAGPFDLLLTLVLREEVDLLEVDLAEVVIAYVDHLERRGELDLEAATEFLVLIAALLELKSRLMLPGEAVEGVELGPGEAAEELLGRLLDAHRFRSAAAHLAERLDAEAGRRFRQAPLPPFVRRASLDDAVAVYDPRRLAAALGTLLELPKPVDLSHVSVSKVTVAERLAHLRALLQRGRFTFDAAVARADRVTVAVTLFALLELYKQGEATWIQDEPFGEVVVEATAVAAVRPVVGASAVSLSLEAQLEALLFLSADAVRAEALADATGAELHEVVTGLERLREGFDYDRRGLVLRELSGGWILSTHPETEEAARRLLAKPRTPPLTPAQAETLSIVAYLQPVSRPEIARIRGVNAESAATTLLERGLIEESGRSEFGAVLYPTTDLFLRLFGLRSLDDLAPLTEFDPSPELEAELRERLLRAGEARGGNVPA